MVVGKKDWWLAVVPAQGWCCLGADFGGLVRVRACACVRVAPPPARLDFDFIII